MHGPRHDSDAALDAMLTELASAPERRPPARAFGHRYEVVRFIGQGTFGAVYEANDRELGRRVAIKRLHRRTPNAQYHFKQEFRALSDICHAGLVRLYELNCEGDDWWLTMEFIDGEPLDHFLSAHPHCLADAFLQLAEGIGALHAAGKLHRDLKPSNILVDEAGRVVLLDFGMVSGVDDDGSTSTGGTPLYMSPEQRKSRPLKPASDWYAFGVTLFHALHGHFPSEPSDARAPLAPPDQRKAWTSLATSLLAEKPEDRPGAAQVQATFTDTAAPRELATTPPDAPFLGREQELHWLRDRLAGLDSDASVEVHVRGSSGVGKTALIQHFLGEVASCPATVFSGTLRLIHFAGVC